MPHTTKALLLIWGESHTRQPDFKNIVEQECGKMCAKYHSPEFCSQRMVFGSVMRDVICRRIADKCRVRQTVCLVYGGNDISDAYRKHGAGRDFDKACNRLIERFRDVLRKAKETPGCSVLIAGLIPRPRDGLLRTRYSEHVYAPNKATIFP
jgi:hypothetical protein